MNIVLRVTLGLAVLAPVYALADPCDDAHDVCLTHAENRGDACWKRCDARFPNDADRWNTCTDQCDAAADREKDSCEVTSEQCAAAQDTDDSDSPTRRTSTGPLFGAKENGEDGCYFGECPDGKTSPSPRTTPTAPPRTTPSTPSPQPTPFPRNPFPQVLMTNVCQTPTFWCRMFQVGAVGYPCYCNSAFGPVNGQTIPQ